MCNFYFSFDTLICIDISKLSMFLLYLNQPHCLFLVNKCKMHLYISYSLAFTSNKTAQHHPPKPSLKNRTVTWPKYQNSMCIFPTISHELHRHTQRTKSMHSDKSANNEHYSSVWMFSTNLTQLTEHRAWP